MSLVSPKHLIAAVFAATLLMSLSLGTDMASSGAPPTIDSEWVAAVTSKDATLYASINPNGHTTAYKLQIDTTGHFKFYQNDSCVLKQMGICAQATVPGEPLAPGLVEPPESSIPSGHGDQTVSANMASVGATLQPGTTYYYRAIAANGASLVEGPTQTFTTPLGEANRHYVKVAPRSVEAGRPVRIYGVVDGCAVGNQVTLYSPAFRGATQKEFAGVPAVFTTVQADHGFSTRIGLAKTVRPRRYRVGGRCGGGNFGSVQLQIRGPLTAALRG